MESLKFQKNQNKTPSIFKTMVASVWIRGAIQSSRTLVLSNSAQGCRRRRPPCSLLIQRQSYGGHSGRKPVTGNLTSTSTSKRNSLLQTVGRLRNSIRQCFHPGAANIAREAIKTSATGSAKDQFTGRQMLKGMLSYIWPKVSLKRMDFLQNRNTFLTIVLVKKSGKIR